MDLLEELEIEESGKKLEFDKYKFITSYSRLNFFVACAEQYRLRHVLKEPYTQPFSEALVLGNLCHSVLEEVLDPNTDITDTIEAYTLHLERCLKALDLSTNSININEVIETSIALASLLYRCQERCTDPELRIRNKDGSIPKNPIEYAPIAFSKQMHEQGLNDKKMEIDTWAVMQNSSFVDTSLSWLLAKAVLFVKYWSIPNWVDKVLNVELEFSSTQDNMVYLPRSTNVIDNNIKLPPLYGKIDLRCVDRNGQLVILDHKTGKSMPDEQTVLHHPQLNLYAYAHKQIYGYWPDVIGINYLPNNIQVLAKCDKDIATQIAYRYGRILEASYDESNYYISKHPTDYMSPCIKRDYKSGRITYKCPYIEKCWPYYVETLPKSLVED
jgi:ATP-dependent helicase/DNAse subunit B